MEQIIYEAFSRYEDQDPPGTEHKLPNVRFGVTWAKLKYHNGAVNGSEVEKIFKEVFAGRTVVIHGGGNDKTAFKHEQAFEGAAHVLDTQILCANYQPDGTPGLAKLAEKVLGKTIQGGGGGKHSPVEDAKATVAVYLRQKGSKSDEEIEEDQKAYKVEKARKKAENAWRREVRRQQGRGEGALGWY